MKHDPADDRTIAGPPRNVHGPEGVKERLIPPPPREEKPGRPPTPERAPVRPPVPAAAAPQAPPPRPDLDADMLNTIPPAGRPKRPAPPLPAPPTAPGLAQPPPPSPFGAGDANRRQVPESPASPRRPPEPPAPQAEHTNWPGAGAPAYAPPINPGWDSTGTPDDPKSVLAPSPMHRPASSPGTQNAALDEGFHPPEWTQYPSAPKPVQARIPAPAPAPPPPPPAPAYRPPAPVRPEPYLPPHRIPPSNLPGRMQDREPDDFRTMGIGEGLIPALPGKFLTLQYFDGVKTWRDLAQVQTDGHILGRDSFPRGIEAARYLAPEHLYFTCAGDQVFAKELQTTNGVYLKLASGRAVELTTGMQFQVGHHVIEFRAAEPMPPIEPLVAPTGEVFRSRRLVPLAFLDFIGPDNRPEVVFPLTKLEGTILGREGEACDIALPGDDWASRMHAKISPRDGKFYLQDLNSLNGTFVRIQDETAIRCGSLANPNACDELLIGVIKIRVVERG